MKPLVLALTMVLVAGCGETGIPFLGLPAKVKVVLSEGRLTVDRTTVKPAHRVVFEVKNATEQTHHVVVAVTGFPPDKLPVKDGRVRYYTHFDEPHRLEFRDGGGWSEQAAPGYEPTGGPDRREPGVMVRPGQTVIYRETYMYDPVFRRGTAFALFCNEPGHYEKGEYAGVVVK